MSTESTTKLDLEAIEARANAATDGPWVTRQASGAQYVFGPHHSIAWTGLVEDDREDAPIVADAAFIAHVRQDVPNLVAEVRRLRAEAAPTTTEWGVRYERPDPEPLDPATRTMAVLSEENARAAVKNGAPIHALNRRVVSREVTAWTEATQ